SARRGLGRALGIVLGAYFAGNIIGAPIAGVIAASIGFRAAVAIAAVLLAGSAALTFGLRSVPPHVERGPFRPPRTFWILLGITPFAAMLSIVSLAFLPVYLREVAAIPLDRLGVYLGLVSVGAAGLAVAAGRFADAGGTVAGFLYEADPLLPFIASAALALPVAAIVAAVLAGATPSLRSTEVS